MANLRYNRMRARYPCAPAVIRHSSRKEESVAQPNAPMPRSTAQVTEMPADDGYPLRGTVVLTLLYLLVIIAGWGFVYYQLLRQG